MFVSNIPEVRLMLARLISNYICILFKRVIRSSCSVCPMQPNEQNYRRNMHLKIFFVTSIEVILELVEQTAE
jgi:hypothetical protein